MDGRRMTSREDHYRCTGIKPIEALNTKRYQATQIDTVTIHSLITDSHENWCNITNESNPSFVLQGKLVLIWSSFFLNSESTFILLQCIEDQWMQLSYSDIRCPKDHENVDKLFPWWSFIAECKNNHLRTWLANWQRLMAYHEQIQVLYESDSPLKTPEDLTITFTLYTQSWFYHYDSLLHSAAPKVKTQYLHFGNFEIQAIFCLCLRP